MEVTRSNFLQLLPHIEKVISECDFVAIDTEMSGLRRGRGGNIFDDHEERYSKMRDSSMGYSLIQFGLSCFKRNSSEDHNSSKVVHYSSEAFNFHIFPYKVKGLIKNFERSFEVQPSALEFLRTHGFDFNFMIDNGISWLNVDEEKETEDVLRRSLQSEGDDSGSSDSIRKAFVIPPEHHDFVNEINEKIEAFIGDATAEKLDLSPCNPFRRRIIYESIRSSQFNEQLQVQTCSVSKTSRDQYISVTRTSKEAKVKRIEEILAEATGVSKVIQSLIKHKKPVVGHNAVLDLMHTVNQFIAPLPRTYSEFKELVKNVFPSIYDTKFIASTVAFKDIIKSSVLDEMLTIVSKSPFPKVEVTREQNGAVVDSPAALHQAWYDAHITGVCFIAMNEYLARTYKPKSGVCEVDEASGINVETRRFENKLHLTYTFDFTHLNMGGDEPALERNHVFYVTFPKEWKTSDLIQLFSAFGYVSVGWLNEVSALVGLKDASKWKEARKSLQKGPVTQTYSVSSYQEYMRKVKGAPRNEQPESQSTVVAAKRKQSESLSDCAPVVTTSVTSSNGSKKNKSEASGDNGEKVVKLFEENADW